MVTLQQLRDLESADRLSSATFHYTGRQACSRTVGPRGGVTERIIAVRVSGSLKTWKTRPEDFRLPVKHGLRDSSAIEHTNRADWHLASGCPINAGEN